jgi:acetyl-CoA C-acetyltransferase
MYIAFADAGVDPKYFPEAPTVALPIALEKAGLKPENIAAWEVNEAFSVVVRIVEKVLGVDPSKINVNGCANTFLAHAFRS